MTEDPFVEHRRLLFTVAYEMLGSAVDAEDVLQESWLKWNTVDRGEIRDGRIAPEAIREFIGERLKTGHASPLEQVVFWFGISGVSRALSHQFVRHRIGISFEQQSQRYVRYKEERLDYVMPKTWRDVHGMADEYDRLMREITRVYELALAKGRKLHDKREAEKAKDWKREAARIMRERG